MSTIRAFGLKQKVTEDFHACNDYQAESWLMFISSVRWFGMRLDLISTLFSIVAIYAPVIALYVSGGMCAQLFLFSILTARVERRLQLVYIVTALAFWLTSNGFIPMKSDSIRSLCESWNKIVQAGF